MSHWNHRVVQRMVTDFGEPVSWLGIHEVFYGFPEGLGWTNEPIAVEGESIAELRETLERMMRALDKPIIIDEEGTNPQS